MSYQSKHTGAAIDAGIDAAIAALPKTGGTMTGALILNGSPVNNLGAATKKYVDDAVNGIALTPGNDGEDGVSVTHVWDGTVLHVTSASGTSSADLKGAKGDTGATGANGEDGVSPTVKVATISGGHRVTITDVNGAKSFDVMDGEDGSGGAGGSGADGEDGATFTPSVSSDGVLSWTNDKGLTNPDPVNIKGPQGDKGEPGENGENGFSPTIAVTETTGGHTVTITDASGAKTFTVKDGEDGASGSGGGSGDMQKSVYDVDGSGVVDNAERLGGKLPEEYADAEHTHPHISITYPQFNETWQDPNTGEEQFTGDYWIDGKPIYRRTANGYVGAANTDVIFQTIPRVGSLIKMYGYVQLGDSLLPINHFWSASWKAVCYLKHGSGTTTNIIANCHAACNIYVVVEFTKA